MNNQLQNMFSKWYGPKVSDNSQGASSISGTQKLRDNLPTLWKQYNITSMFDAGSNDCNWSQLLSKDIKYCGGDISTNMVEHVQTQCPWLDIKLHDVTTDPLPDVDLLFIRDVAIHLSTDDKKLLLKNWMSSNIPWLLITHNQEADHNIDVNYSMDFPWAPVNWRLSPWNFPMPTNYIDEMAPNGRCMALWHRDQIQDLI
jgi:hypothetical protein